MFWLPVRNTASWDFQINLWQIQEILTLWFPEVINMKFLPIIYGIIQQTGDENIQTYQGEVAILIQHQILITNLQKNA